jgi:hypothetical protein
MKSRILNVGVLLCVVTITFSGCGSSANSPEKAALAPCETMFKFSEKIFKADFDAAKTYAKVAEAQFNDISALDPIFARFAVVIGPAAEQGYVDDISGYSDLLGYCKESWTKLNLEFAPDTFDLLTTP